MNKEKAKTTAIAVLSITLIAVCIFLFNGNEKTSDYPDEQPSEKITISQTVSDNLDSADSSAKVKEAVCKNFLTVYYTVYHEKSKLVNLPECKKYVTDNLYSSLSPENESLAEYSDEEIDIDYCSSISINQCYQDINNPNKLLIKCTIKKTVNKLQSINDYFVLFNLTESEEGWLINNFELLSQGA